MENGTFSLVMEKLLRSPNRISGGNRSRSGAGK
jgi:hypothetical protein